MHRSGYCPGRENMATHARRRYRLRANPNQPHIDPSLWIVYYHQTEPQNHHPARSISITEEVRRSMTERAQLQVNGQLQRKEFMLHDRESWPNIPLPQRHAAPYAQQPMGYPGNVMAHMNRSQYPVYMQPQQAVGSQGDFGPSPAKRPRHASSGHAHGSMTAIPAPVSQDPVLVAALADEESTSGADYMDLLTPRDISLHRYVQHHEWLEEILSSPFDTRQIIPSELGLGRKGELESLTRDFFNAPIHVSISQTLPDPEKVTKEHVSSGTPVVDDIPSARIGKLEPGKAEDFTRRATEKIAEINAEMERLKRQHAKRMAKFSRGHALKQAEQNIRIATLESMSRDLATIAPEQGEMVEGLTRDLESKLGQQIKPIAEVECVQKGGLEEKSPPSNDSDRDINMMDTLAEFNGAQPPSPKSLVLQNEAITNYTRSVDETAQISTAPVVDPQTTLGNASINQMQSLAESKDASMEDQITASKDDHPVPLTEDPSGLENFASDGSLHIHGGSSSGNNVQDLEQSVHEGNEGVFEEPNDFGEGIDFGSLDTPGDELSGYAQEMEDMAAGDEVDSGLNDSALGDAFDVTERLPEQEDQPEA